jgi:hypothetical protein|tara:strand:+ start:283 stop:1659 length:1377 start_codon:yes stop_codon:yes gene_type:complete
MIWRGKQVTAIQDETRELDVEGALRASKTTLCLRKELKAAVREPGIIILLARWTDDATHGILKPVWRKLCDEAGLDLTWNGQEQYDELSNGSRVYVRGLKSQDQTSRYSKFRGLTLARIYVDQAEEIPKDIYLELAARLSQKGYRHQITISPNAVEENHWIAHEFPTDNSTPSRSYVSLSVHDNAHNLPSEVIPNLERLYPPSHPKHRTMVLGLRGMNVIGEPVYGGAFARAQHEVACDYDPELPLDEAIDFGKHHPCVVWRQTSPFGQVRYLGGILGQGMYLEDFLPVILSWRARWFPRPCEVRSCCDPAGGTDTSHGIRDNGVAILRKAGITPTWRPNANAPDVRLAMIERTAGLMRRRSANGDEAFVVALDERWLRVSPDQITADRFLADGFEAGYVWDEHMVSVGSKQMRKPKKDGWFEHGQNCSEYLELTFNSDPLPPPEAPVVPYRPTTAWG